MNFPFGVAVDSSGNIFIADAANNLIRKVDTSGIISTVAGNGSAGYSGDGGSAVTSRLDSPRDVAVDSAGNLFIADYNNHRVRKVLPGTAPTPTPTPETVVSVDAPATAVTESTFTARVYVSDVTDFGSGEFRVSFDPDVLAIDDISPGVGVTDGDIGGTVIRIVGTTRDSPGTIKVEVNVPDSSGPSGSGFLADISFQVIGAAGESTTIDLESVVLNQSPSQPIETTTLGTNFAIVSNCEAGDVNDDGSVNALDITAVELIVTGVLAETSCADANQDGSTNSLDITATELLVAG